MACPVLVDAERKVLLAQELRQHVQSATCMPILLSLTNASEQFSKVLLHLQQCRENGATVDRPPPIAPASLCPPSVEHAEAVPPAARPQPSVLGYPPRQPAGARTQVVH